jgi:hypothetical protein
MVFDNAGNLKSGKKITFGADIKYKLDNHYFIPHDNFTYFFFGGATASFTTSL